MVIRQTDKVLACDQCGDTFPLGTRPSDLVGHRQWHVSEDNPNKVWTKRDLDILRLLTSERFNCEDPGGRPEVEFEASIWDRAGRGGTAFELRRAYRAMKIGRIDDSLYHTMSEMLNHPENLSTVDKSALTHLILAAYEGLDLDEPNSDIVF